MSVRELKCPNCGGSMQFDPRQGQVRCDYCDSEFEAASLEEYAQILEQSYEDHMDWAQQETERATEQATVFTCPACGGEIITDDVRAATRCPYCDSPAVMTSRVSGIFRPDCILPFSVTKEQAIEAYRNFCRKKPLLPSVYTKRATMENITGIYAPFWIFDCDSEIAADYKATRVSHWSDSKFNYTKTDFYYIYRRGNMRFSAVPVDGSSKLDNAYTESIEPFDLSRAVPFNTAYLTGFAADKYDEDAAQAEKRANARIKASGENAARGTVTGYATVLTQHSSVSLSHTKATYALLPIWILNTRYKGKIYTFAMNGQTGKFVGKLPSSAAKGAAWFGGITAALTALFFGLSFFL